MPNPPADPPRLRRGPVLWMLAAAAAQVALLARAHLTGDVDPAGREYGASAPGELAHFLRMGALELLVLAAILRPWSYHRAPGRALLALAPWVPWVFFSALVCMHCGPVGGALVVWRMGMAVALVVAVLVSATARHRARRSAGPRPPSP